MNFIDLIIVLIVIAGALRGAQLGFARQFFSLTGFIVGLITGIVIATQAVKILEDPLDSILASTGILLFSSFIFSYAGQIIGFRLAKITRKSKLLELDSVFGSVFTTFIILTVVWLVASVFSGVPYRAINRQMSSSFLINHLNDVYPPAPGVLAKLGSYINPDFFPRVFTGPEPRPIGPVSLPDSQFLRDALENAGPSVVRIESVGCGGLLTGSGFVAGENLIITNAHVIAGVSEPTIVDTNGRHASETVLFDPAQDIAILRAEGNLAGKPLPFLRSTLNRNDAAVTLGYPGGGPIEAVPAGVLAHIRAVGRDIYYSKLAVRDVYQLQTRVTTGNSGGPVVLADGTVAGVIFAKSDSGENTGYALTSTSVQPLLEKAQGTTGEVSTGTCTR